MHTVLKSTFYHLFCGLISKLYSLQTGSNYYTVILVDTLDTVWYLINIFRILLTQACSEVEFQILETPTLFCFLFSFPVKIAALFTIDELRQK